MSDHHRHYTLTLLEAGGQALDMATAKAHLRVDHSDDDSYIAALITIAQGLIDGRDGRLGRALLTQKWRMQSDRFAPWPYGPAGGYASGYGYPRDDWSYNPWKFRRMLEIRIPLPPLQTVDSVSYIDQTGVTQTLASSAYRVISGGGSFSSIIPVTGTTWPVAAIEPDAVTIDFTAGYTTADALTAERPGITQAMMLLVGLWYENREAALVAARAAAIDLPFAVDALLAPHRVSWF